MGDSEPNNEEVPHQEQEVPSEPSRDAPPYDATITRPSRTVDGKHAPSTTSPSAPSSTAPRGSKSKVRETEPLPLAPAKAGKVKDAVLGDVQPTVTEVPTTRGVTKAPSTTSSDAHSQSSGSSTEGGIRKPTSFYRGESKENATIRHGYGEYTVGTTITCATWKNNQICPEEDVLVADYHTQHYTINQEVVSASAWEAHRLTKLRPKCASTEKGGEDPFAFRSFVLGQDRRYVGDVWEGASIIIPHGVGTWEHSTWPFPHLYAGQFCEGSYHGYGLYIYQAGGEDVPSFEVYIGEWRNGKRHGIGVYYFYTGDIYIGSYEEDMRHGEGLCFHAKNLSHTYWTYDRERRLHGTYAHPSIVALFYNRAHDCFQRAKIFMRAIPWVEEYIFGACVLSAPLLFQENDVLSGSPSTLLAYLVSPHHRDGAFVDTFLIMLPSLLTNNQFFFLLSFHLGDDNDSSRHFRLWTIIRTWLRGLYLPYPIKDSASGTALLRMLAARHAQKYPFLIDVMSQLKPSELHAVAALAYSNSCTASSTAAAACDGQVANAGYTREDSHATLTLSPSKEYDRLREVLSITPDALAETLTHLELAAFRLITPIELLRHAGLQLGINATFGRLNDEEDELMREVYERRIRTITVRFNVASVLVMKSILTSETVKERAVRLRYWCEVARHLLHHRNMQWFFIVVSALCSTHVRRLTTSWAASEYQQKITAFENILSPIESFRAYRTVVAGWGPPWIPYLGIVLKDLAHFVATSKTPPSAATLGYSGAAGHWNSLYSARRLLRTSYTVPLLHSAPVVKSASGATGATGSGAHKPTPEEVQAINASLPKSEHYNLEPPTPKSLAQQQQQANAFSKEALSVESRQKDCIRVAFFDFEDKEIDMKWWHTKNEELTSLAKHCADQERVSTPRAHQQHAIE